MRYNVVRRYNVVWYYTIKKVEGGITWDDNVVRWYYTIKKVEDEI